MGKGTRDNMRLYKCQCGFAYVIGKRHVFGPIWPNGNAIAARMMRVEQWEDNYGDCAESYYSITIVPHTSPSEVIT